MWLGGAGHRLRSALSSKVSEAQRCAKGAQSVSKGPHVGRLVLLVVANTHQRLCTGKEHSPSSATATQTITGTGMIAVASALILVQCTLQRRFGCCHNDARHVKLLRDFNAV